MATLLSDDFTRANSTTVVGSPDIGPAPVTQAGVCGISANSFYASTASGMVTYDLLTPNVELSTLVSSVSATLSAMIVLGYASATDYWGAAMYSDNISLIRSNPAGVWVVQEVACTNPNGTKLTASYIEGVVRFYRNDVLVMNYEVDVITATRHGIRLNSTTARIDDLRGYDATPLDVFTNGGTVSGAQSVIPTATFFMSAFAYQGHDTKLQDQAAGA